MRAIYDSPNGKIKWPLYQCIMCGNYEYYSYSGLDAEKNICFTCDFWQGYYENRHDDHAVRIKGEHFYWGPDEKPFHLAGFAGREFKIRFFDGNELITHNLWSQGTIPILWREKMPDNAEWVKSNE